MQYVCDAGELTWFRLETAGEAARESQEMDHAVEKYFRRAHEQATREYVAPAGVPAMEQNIGLKAHIERTMPIFLTLRDKDGAPCVTAMLPRNGRGPDAMSPVVVGHGNTDPYADYEVAIKMLSRHLGYELDRRECYPYRR